MVIRTQYLERLRPFYDSELVKVITGIRRCGKSTILRQVIAEIKENGIEDSHIVYINFEDYKYHKLTDADAFYEYVEQKIIGRLQVQVEQNLSSNYISGIHLIKKSVEQFIRSVVA